ncbi:MAG: hypothetical protein VKJ04_00825 [Vampirovibrionales bacterium]|nr:hypothetical protein [Vampirovibrionales bacterium]
MIPVLLPPTAIHFEGRGKRRRRDIERRATSSLPEDLFVRGYGEKAVNTEAATGRRKVRRSVMTLADKVFEREYRDLFLGLAAGENRLHSLNEIGVDWLDEALYDDTFAAGNIGTTDSNMLVEYEEHLSLLIDGSEAMDFENGLVAIYDSKEEALETLKTQRHRLRDALYRENKFKLAQQLSPQLSIEEMEHLGAEGLFDHYRKSILACFANPGKVTVERLEREAALTDELRDTETLKAKMEAAIAARTAVRLELLTRHKDALTQAILQSLPEDETERNQELERINETYGAGFLNLNEKPVADTSNPVKSAPARQVPASQRPSSTLSEAEIRRLETKIRDDIAKLRQGEIPVTQELLYNAPENVTWNDLSTLCDGLTPSVRKSFLTFLSQQKENEKNEYANFFKVFSEDINKVLTNSSSQDIPKDVKGEYREFLSIDEVINGNLDRKNKANRVLIEKQKQQDNYAVAIIKFSPYFPQWLQSQVLVIRADFLTVLLNKLVELHGLRREGLEDEGVDESQRLGKDDVQTLAAEVRKHIDALQQPVSKTPLEVTYGLFQDDDGNPIWVALENLFNGLSLNSKRAYMPFRAQAQKEVGQAYSKYLAEHLDDFDQAILHTEGVPHDVVSSYQESREIAREAELTISALQKRNRRGRITAPAETRYRTIAAKISNDTITVQEFYRYQREELQAEILKIRANYLNKLLVKLMDLYQAEWGGITAASKTDESLDTGELQALILKHIEMLHQPAQDRKIPIGFALFADDKLFPEAKDANPAWKALERLSEGLTQTGKNIYEQDRNVLQKEAYKTYAEYFDAYSSDFDDSILGHGTSNVPEELKAGYAHFKTDIEASREEVAGMRRQRSQTQAEHKKQVRQSNDKINREIAAMVVKLSPYIAESIQSDLLKLRADFLSDLLEKIMKLPREED